MYLELTRCYCSSIETVFDDKNVRAYRSAVSRVYLQRGRQSLLTPPVLKLMRNESRLNIVVLLRGAGKVQRCKRCGMSFGSCRVGVCCVVLCG